MIRPPRQAVIVFPLLAILLLAAAPVASRAAVSQPVAFSHKVHVTLNGIDCRFCHTAATKSNFAGIPSVEKCMICHRVIAVDSPEIKKVARYWKEKKPIPWNRVLDVPDFVYFPHYRMVNAGISCLTCHPGIDQVDAAVQRRELTMGFCLKCHRSRGVSIDCWTCHK
ncbi:MAG: cytochrome c family protein [Deltaproteobacteria bacterium]|nr:cytochrome c family protein [Deltaproteobacteria bacterium]